MSGTADSAGPPGNGPGEPAAPDPGDEELTDHQYFRRIEEAFIDLRGSPLLLSPKDWQTARDWHRRGIPVELVVRTLEELFARRREEGREGKVSSLRYCAPAVEAAWTEARELTAAAAGRSARPGRAPGAGRDAAADPAARLDALVAALPEGLPGRDDLARRIRALAPGDGPGGPGTERGVEEALAALEEKVVEELTEGLPDERRRELEAAVERSLRALEDRLPQAEAQRARRRLLAQRVRRLHRLPTLSLFAPEAEPDPE